jgi:transposase InsO family protein
MAGKVASMDVRLLAAVTATSLAGVDVRSLCVEHDVSRTTFYKWRRRYREEGLAGLEARSRRPRSSPGRIGDDLEDEIVRLRKALADRGVDNGPESIQWELGQLRWPRVPSVATIWRALARRGQITPQPQKRPKASLRRFEAPAPNELWQIDATEWTLADGTTVEIINIIDDHSRLAIASRAVASTTTKVAWNTFAAATDRYGLPVGCLSDNGLAFSGRLRGFEVVFEANLRAAGVRPITSRPRHPQTCGKVERFQQTLKKWLRVNGPCPTLAALQRELDRFRDYYNHRRPHRGIGRVTPATRWAGTAKAAPVDGPIPPPQRRTRVVINDGGVAKLNRLEIGIGVDHAGRPAEIILDGTHAAVYIDGNLIRHVEFDLTKRYQPSSAKRGGPRRARPA